MFPGRPGRPMPPYPPMPPRRPPILGQQQPNRPNIMSFFQDNDGNMDLEKVTKTAQQINSLYGQVSPLISQFFKR
ncbi:YppG-like protein [Oceanobacillus limi]|uniref:YppG-like protein n=1 Tax=Oceanobacillus limi TaxID=930131 RepID=A0A1I0G9P5_9BACI|nr:YppG family protein [Oceanobacillus limi]SET67600.1 YppG-like protein [Oceanobacillus limi]